MVNYVKYLLWSLFFLVGMGEGVSAQIRQMMFEKIDTYNGLGDDRVIIFYRQVMEGWSSQLTMW